MTLLQHTRECKIYLHPTACTRPSFIDAFQRRTGLQVITTPTGLAMATPHDGGHA
ncbi:hypothetical protein [Pseudomonas sp. zjy_14]|uniref:hypothetical protein n=1 Tax=Pseudomonas sp. zjy_14 TaxID=3367264 RepID=UPI00370BC8EC